MRKYMPDSVHVCLVLLLLLIPKIIQGQIILDDLTDNGTNITNYHIGDVFTPTGPGGNGAYEGSPLAATNPASTESSSSIYVEDYSSLASTTGMSVDASIKATYGVFSAGAKLGYWTGKSSVSDKQTIYFAISVVRTFAPESSPISLTERGKDLQKQYAGDNNGFFKMAGSEVVYQIQRRVVLGYIYRFDASSTDEAENIKKELTLTANYLSSGGSVDAQTQSSIRSFESSVRIVKQTIQIGVDKDHLLSLSTTTDLLGAMKYVTDAIKNIQYANALPFAVWVKPVVQILPSGGVLLESADSDFGSQIVRMTSINHLKLKYRMLGDVLGTINGGGQSGGATQKTVAQVASYLDDLNSASKDASVQVPREPDVHLTNVFYDNITSLSFGGAPGRATATLRTPREIFDVYWPAYPVVKISSPRIIQLVDHVLLKNFGTLVEDLNQAQLASLCDINGSISFQSILEMPNLPDWTGDHRGDFPKAGFRGRESDALAMTVRSRILGIYFFGGLGQPANFNWELGVLTGVFQNEERGRSYALEIHMQDSSTITVTIGNARSPASLADSAPKQ